MATDCDSLYGLFVLTIKSSAFQTKENEHTSTFTIYSELNTSSNQTQHAHQEWF